MEGDEDYFKDIFSTCSKLFLLGWPTALAQRMNLIVRVATASCHCQWDLVILSRYTDTNTECGGICPRPMAALLCTAYIYI